jgi:hypothetical protein
VVFEPKTSRMVWTTTDHKPEGVEERTRIEAAGGHVSADRVDGNLAMSRAFGDWAYKSDGARPAHAQKVIVTPTLTKLRLLPGQAVCLFCDGLIEQLTRQQLVDMACRLAQTGMAPDRIARNLVQAAFASQSRDNMSLMLLRGGIFEPRALESRGMLQLEPLPVATSLDACRTWYDKHVAFLQRYAYAHQKAHIQQLTQHLHAHVEKASKVHSTSKPSSSSSSPDNSLAGVGCQVM